MPSRLEVIAGPMFSGKSEELLRRLKREQFAQRHMLVIKPQIDTRTEAFIASREIDNRGHERLTARWPAIVTATDTDLADLASLRFDTLAIDEAQFFKPETFLSAIATLLEKHRCEDFLIIAAGLDLDYRLLPFGAMPGLLAIADDTLKLTAICMRCHARGARFTQRIHGTDAVNQVGGFGDYEVRCRSCHTIPEFARHT